MHGSLFRRQRIVENGRFGFQSFWPVQSASAIYNREFGELRINAKTGKEKALYCRLLGKHMFGNENLFPTVSNTRLIHYGSLNLMRWHPAASRVSAMFE